MDLLGRTTLVTVEMYSRQAAKARLAKSGLKSGSRLRPRLKVVGGEPDV
jgi:hypothetical protein